MPVSDEPSHYLARETLLDDRPVVIRAIRPDDKSALVSGFQRLSSTSVYNRFFTPKSGLTSAELEYLTEVDFVRHVALLAIVEEEGAERAVGVGRFIVDDESGTSAEVAFTVDDEHQGLGIGTHLLAHLTRIGRALGLTRFWAEVRASNRPMLAVFEHCGLPMRQTTSGGEVTVELGFDS